MYRNSNFNEFSMKNFSKRAEVERNREREREAVLCGNTGIRIRRNRRRRSICRERHGDGQERKDTQAKDGHGGGDRIANRWEWGRARKGNSVGRDNSANAIESRTGSGVNDSRLELVHSE